MSQAAAKKPPEATNKAIDGKEHEETVKPKKDWLSFATLFLVFINILVVGGVGFFVNKMWDKIKDLQIEISKKAEIEEIIPEVKEEKKESHIGKAAVPQVQGTLFPLESFLVNISSDQGPKFLQAQMELELGSPALEEEVTRKKAAVRDAIIVLLSSRSYKELREPSGMKVLRQDMIKVVNNLLSSGKVKEVYFTQFHFN